MLPLSDSVMKSRLPLKATLVTKRPTRGLDEVCGPQQRVETPAPHAGMGYDQAAVRVERQAVRTGQSAGKLDGNADLGHAAVDGERDAPDGVSAGYSHKEDVLVQVEHKTVRTRNRIDETRELAVGRVAVDAAGRIVQARLALVGEVQVAIGGEVEIVDALEALAPDRFQQRRRPSRSSDRGS